MNQASGFPGHKTMAESVFLCVGLVRNGAKSIRREVERLSDALGGSKALHFLFIESDSDDGTVVELEKISGTFENLRYVSLGRLGDELPKRTARLAHCRNIYVKEIRENPIYRGIDYVVVADMDGLNTKISAEGVESCWTHDEWDACFANPDGPYYDIWALRHPDWSPNDCWAQYDFLNKYSKRRERNLFASVHARMITIPKNADWIEVNSAFGGLAIYKRALFEDAEYIGLDAAGEEICEHVTLHNQVVGRGARLFINPAFINAGRNGHTRELFFIRKIRRKIKHAKKRMRERAASRR